MQIDRPIAIASVIVITLLLVFFLVMPEYNRFQTLQTQLGEKKAEFNAKFDYYAAIAKTYDELQVHKDDLKKIDDALPQSPARGKLIYFLQEDAKANGLILKDVSLSDPSADTTGTSISNTIKDIFISMDVSGDYTSLERFMASLEGSSRIFEIKNISFGYVIGSQYNFNLKIITHSY